MDAVSIMRGQLTQAHEMIEQAMADLTNDQLHHRAAGGAIQSIAAIYAHTVTGEDALVNVYLRAQPSLLERDGWAAKLGFSMPEQGMLSAAWSEAMRGSDIAALREFAQQVYAATDDYLGSLSGADLDRATTFGMMGEMPVGAFLGNVIVWHVSAHGGEICALKGVLGGQGLPF